MVLLQFLWWSELGVNFVVVVSDFFKNTNNNFPPSFFPEATAAYLDTL